MIHERSPVARTPLHHWHAAHGARFANREGWQVVAVYTDPQREAEAARAGLGLVDISSFAKISVRGPEAASLMPGGVPLSPGGVCHWQLAASAILVCRLTEDHLLLLASTPAATELRQQLAALRAGRAVVQTDVTSAYTGYWVMGPLREEFLSRLTHLDVRPASFPVNTCAETALAGVEALLVRTAELSLPALRIYVAWDLGEYVWERLMEAGCDGQITHLGLNALARLGCVSDS
jgi:heterotetrameric sarcosine oxidase gamma subunit